MDCRAHFTGLRLVTTLTSHTVTAEGPTSSNVAMAMEASISQFPTLSLWTHPPHTPLLREHLTLHSVAMDTPSSTFCCYGHTHLPHVVVHAAPPHHPQCVEGALQPLLGLGTAGVVGVAVEQQVQDGYRQTGGRREGRPAILSQLVIVFITAQASITT